MIDALRYLTLLLFGIGVNLAAWGVYYYFERRRIVGSPPPGLLPKHVIVVGAATILLAISAITNTVERFGEGPSLYLPLNLFGVGGWTAAMWLIFSYERRMLRVAQIDREQSGGLKRRRTDQP